MTAINNPYIDSATGTFKNKLGISDPEVLNKAEYIASSNRARELREKPIAGNYDLPHLSGVHKHLMQDVYDWAGQTRTLNFSKKDSFEKEWTTKFAPAKDLEKISKSISDELKDKNFLKNLDKETFVKELTSTYTKINYLHPFPEGNGRATQELMSQLAKDAGYEINYKGVGKIIWNHAAARSQEQTHRETGATRPGDSTLMQQVFSQIVSPIKREAEISPKTQQKEPNREQRAGGIDYDR